MCELTFPQVVQLPQKQVGARVPNARMQNVSNAWNAEQA